jgi:hypothetical protein
MRQFLLALIVLIIGIGYMFEQIAWLAGKFLADSV